MPPAQSTRLRLALLGTLTICLAIGFSLVIVEVSLRLLTNTPYKNPLYIQYHADKDVGLWMSKSGRSYINSFGMYEREVALKKAPGVTRIAMLGDSFMQGVHPVIGHRMSEVLADKLGDKFEVLNFGISSVGTVQELFIYRHKVKPFKPDVVILGLLTGNDIRNNSRALEKSSTTDFLQYAPYCEVTVGDKIKCHPATRPPRLSAPQQLKKFLRENLHIYHLLSRLRHALAKKSVSGKSTLWQRPWPPAYVDFGVYGPPLAPEWQEAWKVTEYALQQLKSEVEADGGRFILMTLTDPLQLETNAKKAVGELTGVSAPADFDPIYPNRRISNIAKKLGIAHLNLLPTFKAYIQGNKVSAAAFSFPDDGHWNRLGHSVAGKSLAEYLRREP
jgi:lysophospholipase L1-like esterase